MVVLRQSNAPAMAIKAGSWYVHSDPGNGKSTVTFSKRYNADFLGDPPAKCARFLGTAAEGVSASRRPYRCARKTPTTRGGRQSGVPAAGRTMPRSIDKRMGKRRQQLQCILRQHPVPRTPDERCAVKHEKTMCSLFCRDLVSVQGVGGSLFPDVAGRGSSLASPTSSAPRTDQRQPREHSDCG